jgi:hypothetical protein
MIGQATDQHIRQSSAMRETAIRFFKEYRSQMCRIQALVCRLYRPNWRVVRRMNLGLVS